jgi:flagellar biosynthesis protein FliQ
MIYQNVTEIAQAALEVSQAAILPILGVCLALSVLFLILQLVLSLQDFNLQFLVRFILLVMVCAFMAKSASQKFVEFTKSVFESAPTLVR